MGFGRISFLWAKAAMSCVGLVILLVGCGTDNRGGASPDTLDAGLFLADRHCTYAFELPLRDFANAGEVGDCNVSCECVRAEPFTFFDRQSQSRCGLLLTYLPSTEASVSTSLELTISVYGKVDGVRRDYTVRVWEVALARKTDGSPRLVPTPDPFGA